MPIEAIPELRDATAAERPPSAQSPAPAPASTVASKSEQAKKAADVRWASKFDWDNCPLEEGLQRLADIRAETEKASLTMQRRVSEIRVAEVNCYNPNCRNGQNGKPKVIDVASGHFGGSRTRHNPDTGLAETAYACSAACFLYLSANFVHKQSQRD